jgi:hypothetical protein
MGLVRHLLGVMAIAAVCCAAAGADDDGSALRGSVLGAMAATSSFVVDVINPQGITGSAIVEPQLGRTKVQGSGGPHTLTIYALGGYLYEQFDGAAWQRRKLPGSGGNLIAPISAAATVSLLPDTHDATGALYGAFSAVTTLPVPGIGAIPNVAMQCTYDKSTLLLHTCVCQYATFTFHSYNDPKNAVDLPPEAKNAAELAPLGADGLPQGK